MLKSPNQDFYVKEWRKDRTKLLKKKEGPKKEPFYQQFKREQHEKRELALLKK